MKIQNMTSPNGNKVANQFIIYEEGHGANGNFIRRETFQSYSSVIAIKTVWNDRTDIVLDKDTWDYSVTTGKYRNQFLNEDKKTTEKKIKSGEYKLKNLN
ncbi:MAG: hypothetical protein WC389_21645 [Lutibacter sp.]|jgi:hypothetical protein